MRVSSASIGRSRIVSACGRRSRSPGVSMPVTSPRSRACASAVWSASPNSSLNSTSTPGVSRSCSDRLSSTRPRATCLLDERPDIGFDRGEHLRDAKLQVEMAMVQRSDRYPDRRALVLAGHRRKTGHRFDHDVTARRSPVLRASSRCI